MKKITVLIAEDHKLVSQSMEIMFNTDPRFTVIAQCNNGEDAVTVCRRMQPDIVMMDINMPGMDGYEATKQISAFCPRTKIICVSMHAEPFYAKKMMEAGVSGYVTKSSSHQVLLEAAEEVYNGKKYICREIKDILSTRKLEDREEKTGVENLTKSELAIITLVKQGLSSKEIGVHLSVSYKTVEVHRYNILKKLKLPNVASLINYMNQYELAFR